MQEEEQKTRERERFVDPSVRHVYESNPYDPLAAARMMGRFLGALLAFDRKMNWLVMAGSIAMGVIFLVPGMISGNVFGITFGAAILLNVGRNIRTYYL